MMHYPGKITCDTDTHQTCRLPPTFFEVLITKRMKGLRNVGVIREFIGSSKDENRVAKSITHSDYPMLGNCFDLLSHLQIILVSETMRRTYFLLAHLSTNCLE